MWVPKELEPESEFSWGIVWEGSLTVTLGMLLGDNVDWPKHNVPHLMSYNTAMRVANILNNEINNKENNNENK